MEYGTLDAIRKIQAGAQYPYDAPDSFWNDSGSEPPKAVDWAHEAARGIICDLTDRGGIKHGFDGIDEEIREEIVLAIADIIRAAAPN